MLRLMLDVVFCSCKIMSRLVYGYVLMVELELYALAMMFLGLYPLMSVDATSICIYLVRMRLIKLLFKLFVNLHFLMVFFVIL